MTITVHTHWFLLYCYTKNTNLQNESRVNLRDRKLLLEQTVQTTNPLCIITEKGCRYTQAFKIYPDC